MNEMERGVAIYLGEDVLKHIQQVTVGVAGVGGLGSNCVMHLLRSGFKRFVLVDFDRVDASNLNRQCFTLEQVGQYKVMALSRNMKTINPDVEVDIRTVKLSPENVDSLFMTCDVVIEALDAPEVKQKLVEAYVQSDKLLVAASGVCGVGDAASLRTREVRKGFYVVGDMETECSMDHPPFAPKVTAAAAMQADVVLSHYIDEFKQKGGA